MIHRLPHLGDLPDWRQFRRVAIDIETRDPLLKKLGPGVRRGDGYITGVAVACDDGTGDLCPAYYLPMRHEGGGNYADPMVVLRYLRAQARTFTGDIAGANLQYDLDWLEEAGVTFAPRFYRDLMISGPLLDVPNINGVPNLMGLDAQAARAGVPGKDEAALLAWAKERKLDPKADMWRAHSSIIADYAKQDVRLPLKLLRKHEREIEAQDLQSIYDLESRVLPVLLAMRRRGVRIDFDRLDQVDTWAQEQQAVAMAEISRISGRQVTCADTMTPGALAPCLEAEGVEVPRTEERRTSTGKTTGGGPSIKADWLDGLGTPVAGLLRRARKMSTLRTTFVSSIRSHAIGDRIHCTFNQMKAEREDGKSKGAAFGRCSSSDPNLQNQPARDPEIGPMWRSIYMPDEGTTWVCCDVSSQEPRLILHFAELAGCTQAFEAAEECRTDPNWDNHSMTAAMLYEEFNRALYESGDKRMKALRGDAKEIFLGKAYGMGGGSLCHKLGLPSLWIQAEWAGGRMVEMAGPEGEALIERFNRRVPYVKELTDRVKKIAQKNGFIRTILGRRCRFPIHPQTGRIDWAHKALNRLIQGSAGDQMKLAMVQAHEARIPLQLQVHDELNFSMTDRAQSTRLKEIMIHAVTLRVPILVDEEHGPSWGEVKLVAP